MKIINLKAENVKRLVAIDITPEGDIVIIGGRNANGKSSVLDSVFYALAGSKALPDKPIRNGQKKAKIVVELGDGHGKPVKYVVERTITEAGGGGLRVKAADGALYPSPQKLLDEILGQLAFDPLEFSRLKPRDQADQLRGLLGAEFTRQLAELDAAHKETFDERALKNRELKQAQAQLAAAAQADDGGEVSDEVDVSELTEELTRREEHNAYVAEQERALADVLSQLKLGGEKLAEIERQIAALQERAADIANKMETLENQRIALCEAADAGHNQPRDTAEIKQAINTAATVNATRQRLLKSREDRQALIAKVRTLESDSERMTKELADLNEQKQAVLASAPFPVPGLGFSEGGVTYQGLPFDQASGAEKLRVSVAMGMALNPKLRVMTIRDGSLLDSDGLRMVAEMARHDDYQIWLERAGDSPTGCEVWIEEGAVKQQPRRSLFESENETAGAA